MKKGFTMIELIFVIVILGILAAVAIPKLTNVKGQAEQASAAQSFAVILQDLANNSLAIPLHNGTISKWEDLTNSPQKIAVNGVDCIEFTLNASGGVVTGVSFIANQDAKCNEFYKAPVLRNNDKTSGGAVFSATAVPAAKQECTLKVESGVVAGTYECADKS